MWVAGEEEEEGVTFLVDEKPVGIDVSTPPHPLCHSCELFLLREKLFVSALKIVESLEVFKRMTFTITFEWGSFFLIYFIFLKLIRK